MIDGYGLIDDGAVALSDGHISWVGPSKELPAEFQKFPTQSFDGQLVTPALIDCHTHIVFGGNRANEFEMYSKGPDGLENTPDDLSSQDD